MYLVDTNIWLEVLLQQERSDEVGDLLSKVATDHLFVTDFTLHSIGVIMTRLNENGALLRFVDDLFIRGGVGLLRLLPEDMERLVEISEQFHLDFDDAYQYTAAEKHNLTIVSFDRDFNATDRGRAVPADLLRNTPH